MMAESDEHLHNTEFDREHLLPEDFPPTIQDNTTSGVTIITNNVPRDVIEGYELTPDERKEFDYIRDWENDSPTFFRYKGELYDLGDFEVLRDSRFPGWQACIHDSFFSGILIRYVNLFEQVVVGRYCM